MMETPRFGLDKGKGVVSPDDHVVEPPDLWLKRLPTRYRDAAPHVVRERGRGIMVSGTFEYVTDGEGPPADIWVYEDQRVATPLTGAAVGFDLDDLSLDLMTYDAMRPGCFRQADRLADMDQAGIEASACFPNLFVRFCGQRFYFAKDKDLAALCVEAYNDFQVDEWCAGSNGRLVPLGIVPLWDAQLAAAEVQRTARNGMHAMCFSELPPFLGMPSIHSGYWDPLFAACEENDTVLMMHIGSSSKMPVTSSDAPYPVTSTLTSINSVMAMVDWLWSGVLIRYPRLKIGFSECHAGWVPFYLQRADEVWEGHRAWGGTRDILPEPPSTYFPGRIYCSTFGDPVAFRNLELIGDNLMFESDYPHNDTNWPDSLQAAEKATSHLDAATAEKLIRGNARDLFGLN